jgi:hypothetical protein
MLGVVATRVFGAAAIAAQFVIVGAAVAQDVPPVGDIVEKTNCVAYYAGKDGRAQVSMTITDGQGRTRSRRMTILRRDASSGEPEPAACRNQKYYVYFHRPTDVRGTVLTVWKQSGQDDDRWLYLPALDLVNRIAAGDKRTSFVGSHFFYEDISGRNITEDEHELVEASANYYVVKGRPADPGSVEFKHYVIWIHRGTFVPVKVEFFDAQDRLYRVYQATKVETVQGLPTVVESKMEDRVGGGSTTLKFSRVQYDLGIGDEIFDERFLRNPPRDLLR